MKKLLLIGAMGLTLASCNLDILPENGLTYSNSFETERELNATTSSILYYINTTIGDNSVFAMAGVKADALLDGTQVREWNPRTVMNSEYSWKGLYDIIFESNLLLDNIYRTQGLTTERENYHKGQAEFGLSLLNAMEMLLSLKTQVKLSLIHCQLRPKCSTLRLNMQRKRMTCCLLMKT